MSEPNKPFVSVQPENRTLLEEGLEYAWHQIIDSALCPYPNLKQPQKTPEAFVSLLAAERGVLDWQPSDVLEQRRQTTERAFQIHRKAGTRNGLKEALDALGVDAVIKQGEQPYSLIIEGKLLAQTLSVELNQRINARVGSYKSERDTVSVTLSRSHYVHRYSALVVQSTREEHVHAG